MAKLADILGAKTGVHCPTCGDDAPTRRLAACGHMLCEDCYRRGRVDEHYQTCLEAKRQPGRLLLR